MPREIRTVQGAIDRHWATNKEIANYVWEVLSPDGKLVVMTQWNENFDAETAMSSFGDMVSHVVGGDPNRVVFGWKVSQAYKFRARPLRDAATMPTMEIDVPIGGELLWTYRRVQTIGMLPGTESMQIDFTTLIFGRVLPDGKMDIAQIYPNGETHGHATLEDAFAIT